MFMYHLFQCQCHSIHCLIWTKVSNSLNWHSSNTFLKCFVYLPLIMLTTEKKNNDVVKTCGNYVFKLKISYAIRT